MRYLSSGQGTQEFFTFILPVTSGVAPPEVTEVPTQTGRAFVIKYNGYTDVFVFNDDNENVVETGLFDSNFRYSWARLSEGETFPDEFVLIDGNRLAIGANEIVREENVAHASARRLGHELYMKTGNKRTTFSLAQNTAQPKLHDVIERRTSNRRHSSSDRRRPTSDRRGPASK